MDRRLLVSAVAAVSMLGAAPNSSINERTAAPLFLPAKVATLPNGALVASQSSNDSPLIGAQIFLPAGLVQQTIGQPGVAAVAAAMVMKTPVEGGESVGDVAGRLGAAVTYTIDPQDTRFYLECKASDFARILNDLSIAINHPDATVFTAAVNESLAAANAALKDPVLVTYAMIRQVQYDGTSFADPDAGRAISLLALRPSDALAFAANYRHGAGTVVALSGNVSENALSAAKTAFAGFAPGALPSPKAPRPQSRKQEVVAHRDVAAPWVAVGYSAPAQFSVDFPAMLVIEALLGRGGGVHAFSFGSDATPPDDFVGGYYQYEAQPATFVEFFNGAGIDQDLRNLEDGIGRLRSGSLPPDLLAKAKNAALGSYVTSITTLDDESWMLGRAVMSPEGVSFEGALAQSIATVSQADVQRVARKYLGTQTVAIVLPSGQ